MIPSLPTLRAPLVAQMVKRLSAMQETRIRSLGWEDPLEEEMAAHYSILVWTIPWTEEPGKLQFMRLQSQTQLSMHTRKHERTEILQAVWCSQKRKWRRVIRCHLL